MQHARTAGSPGRNIVLLSLSQAVMGSNQSVLAAITALTAASMLTDKAFATLPVSLMIIGTAVATGPAAWLIHTLGRRRGFMLGAVIAIPGAIAASLAIGTGAFWLFCIGLAVLGTSNAFVQQYRFAAADSVSPDLKARAISWVLAGGVLAGFIGPQLSAISKDWIAGHQFAGSYLVLAGLAVLAVIILSGTRLAPTVRHAEDRRSGRRLRQLLASPEVFVPVISGAATYALMVLVMVSAPLAMVYVCGHTTGDAAFAIQWHIVAMYAPGFFTGAVIARIGAHLTAAIGLLAIVGAATANLLGTTTLHFDVALVLLGLGWNFGFIASTTLLSASYRPEEAARVQGLNDQIVFGVMALASIASGLLLQLIGWQSINILVIPIATIGVLALGYGQFRPRRPDRPDDGIRTLPGSTR
jgi:MFS family permease